MPHKSTAPYTVCPHSVIKMYLGIPKRRYEDNIKVHLI